MSPTPPQLPKLPKLPKLPAMADRPERPTKPSVASASAARTTSVRPPHRPSSNRSSYGDSSGEKLGPLMADAGAGLFSAGVAIARVGPKARLAMILLALFLLFFVFLLLRLFANAYLASPAQISPAEQQAIARLVAGLSPRQVLLKASPSIEAYWVDNDLSYEGMTQQAIFKTMGAVPPAIAALNPIQPAKQTERNYCVTITRDGKSFRMRPSQAGPTIRPGRC